MISDAEIIFDKGKTDKKYLMVIAAMCGLATSAAGILVNTGGVFYY